MPTRKNLPYKEGELEVILSLPPTSANIFWLSKLLDRSEDAIKIVFKIAFEHGPFAGAASIQQQKIAEAKKRVDIGIGRKSAQKPQSKATEGN
jgi:hypothetical protein